ncbi:MAG TPA: hypothetical protein DDW89_08920 [Gammaproteobacteria bacterium]|nr:hypothetical protein [Gammaproteobacteria bacterium]
MGDLMHFKVRANGAATMLGIVLVGSVAGMAATTGPLHHMLFGAFVTALCTFGAGLVAAATDDEQGDD